MGEEEPEVIVSLSVVENFYPIIVHKCIHNSYDHVLEIYIYKHYNYKFHYSNLLPPKNIAGFSPNKR